MSYATSSLCIFSDNKPLWSSVNKCTLITDILVVCLTTIAASAIFLMPSLTHLHLVSYCLWTLSGLIITADIIKLILKSKKNNLDEDNQKQVSENFYEQQKIKKFEMPKSAEFAQSESNDLYKKYELKCPEKYRPFFACAPKDFVMKILQSNQYTEEEKEELFSTAGWFYDLTSNGTIDPQSRLDQKFTLYYLRSLAVSHPHFNLLGIDSNQLECPEKKQDFLWMANELANILPPSLENAYPYLFGNALRINENHRTAFVVDLRKKTVEYFNSFGSDSKAGYLLKKLAVVLSNKYGIEFKYIHRTNGRCIQTDSYQCGAWTCKFIEDRIKECFDLKSCSSFDIASYRKVMFAAGFQYRFFWWLGSQKITLQIQSLMHKNKLHDLSYFEVYEWGKSGKMPPCLATLLEKDGARQPQQKINNSEADDSMQLKVNEVNLLYEKFALKCPEKFQPFFACVPKDFVISILRSDKYTEKEKEELFSAAASFYILTPEGTIDPHSWLDQKFTLNYLRSLTTIHPHFNLLETETNPNQLECPTTKESSFSEANRLAIMLPNTLEDSSPYLFGQALQINGNHRTAFIIDLRSKTVEYFNSFGSDSEAALFLKILAQVLSNKYGVEFRYIHRTEDSIIQTDGYQCGAWTCKFIEERIKGYLNPEDYSKFDIAAYRDVIFAKSFQYRFFWWLGGKKLTSEIEDLMEEKNVSDLTQFEAYKLGKTGKMPLRITALIEKDNASQLQQPIKKSNQPLNTDASGHVEVKENELIYENFLLKCPENTRLYFQQIPKDFVIGILLSDLYTSEEKELLFADTFFFYSNSEIADKKSWVGSHITMYYLNSLACTYPHFKVFASSSNQLTCPVTKDDIIENINCLIRVLPPALEDDDDPYLFGHALQINGNHRTAFLVDLRNKTVEYFNSFGSDSEAAPFLKMLAQALSNKYRVKFQYIHRTQQIVLQQDGYECGIWTCKFIEDRINENPNLKECLEFDIASYRKQVFDVAFRCRFYHSVGRRRISKIQNRQKPLDLFREECEWGRTGKIPSDFLPL